MKVFDNSGNPNRFFGKSKECVDTGIVLVSEIT
jgi:hypothetical protein